MSMGQEARQRLSKPLHERGDQQRRRGQQLGRIRADRAHQRDQDGSALRDHLRQVRGDLHAQVLQHARQLRAQPADHGEQLPLHALVEHAESRDQCGDDGADAEELDEVARAEEARDQAADRVQAGLQPWPDDSGDAAEGVSDGPERGLRLARDAGCDASELASERPEPDDHGILLERERG